MVIYVSFLKGLLVRETEILISRHIELYTRDLDVVVEEGPQTTFSFPSLGLGLG